MFLNRLSSHVFKWSLTRVPADRLYPAHALLISTMTARLPLSPPSTGAKLAPIASIIGTTTQK
jgi:hypothetical protein